MFQYSTNLNCWAIKGDDFPISKAWFQASGEQWGRYNLPRYTLWGDLSFQSIWQYIPKTFTVFAGCQGGIDYNVLKLFEATFGKILGNWGIITTKNTTGNWEKWGWWRVFQSSNWGSMKDIYARSPFGEVQGLRIFLGERNPSRKSMAFFLANPQGSTDCPKSSMDFSRSRAICHCFPLPHALITELHRMVLQIFKALASPNLRAGRSKHIRNVVKSPWVMVESPMFVASITYVC